MTAVSSSVPATTVIFTVPKEGDEVMALVPSAVPTDALRVPLRIFALLLQRPILQSAASPPLRETVPPSIWNSAADIP